VRVIRAIEVLLLQIRDDKYNLELMRRMGLQEIYPYKRKSFSLPEFNKEWYFFKNEERLHQGLVYCTPNERNILDIKPAKNLLSWGI